MTALLLLAALLARPRARRDGTASGSGATRGDRAPLRALPPTVGPGWHWLLPLERTGKSVDMLNHHLHVERGGVEAELYYQILEPEKAGETLEHMDDFVADQAREARPRAHHQRVQARTQPPRRAQGPARGALRAARRLT
jgi:hypothetical protein